MTRFAFAGNRRFVLDQMEAMGLQVSHKFVMAGTHLDKQIGSDTRVSRISSKDQMLKAVEAADFDVFVSNGCHYILPVSSLPRRTYVNIHPSALPDLRGVDPVIGAIRYKRAAGATCHVMDDDIDTGPIISQVKIPFSDDLGTSLLYQLSFKAEREAFELAFARGFEPDRVQPTSVAETELISYRRSAEDRTLFFTEQPETLVQKVRAFDNASQGVFFVVGGQTLRCRGARLLENAYVQKLLSQAAHREIVLVFEASMVIAYQGHALELSLLDTPWQNELVGQSVDQLETALPEAL